jgi:hypothetical protein
MDKVEEKNQKVADKTIKEEDKSVIEGYLKSLIV